MHLYQMLKIGRAVSKLLGKFTMQSPSAESLCELARRWFWHGGPTNYLFSVLVGRLCVPFPTAGREKPKSFVAFRLACHGTV